MFRILVCLLLFAGAALTALAEPRYAVLVGNEDYPATVGRLSLPHEDVENIRAALLFFGEWFFVLISTPAWVSKWSEAPRSSFWSTSAVRVPKFGF